jgi:hypothetical protein
LIEEPAAPKKPKMAAVGAPADYETDPEKVIGDHLEFLADSDLSPLRAFVASRQNVRIRPILRADLESRFRARALLFEQQLGRGFAVPVVAFHGTKKEAVGEGNICLFVCFV